MQQQLTFIVNNQVRKSTVNHCKRTSGVCTAEISEHEKLRVDDWSQNGVPGDMEYGERKRGPNLPLVFQYLDARN